jgi:hypothetical protein
MVSAGSCKLGREEVSGTSGVELELGGFGGKAVKVGRWRWGGEMAEGGEHGIGSCADSRIGGISVLQGVALRLGERAALGFTSSALIIVCRKSSNHWRVLPFLVLSHARR